MALVAFPSNQFNLKKYDREQLITDFRKQLMGRVDATYLFGSFATNTHHSDSDIDTILIKNTQTSFIERARKFLDLYAIYPQIDIVVHTSGEFECQLLRAEKPGFWQSVKQTLLRIV